MLMRVKTKYFSTRPHFDESDGGVLDSRAMIISAQGRRRSSSLHPKMPISIEPKPFNSNLIFFFFFSGEYCETEINECGSFPCQHNGTCVDSPGRYTCRCPAGMWTRHLSCTESVSILASADLLNSCGVKWSARVTLVMSVSLEVTGG